MCGMPTGKANNVSFRVSESKSVSIPEPEPEPEPVPVTPIKPTVSITTADTSSIRSSMSTASDETVKAEESRA